MKNNKKLMAWIIALAVILIGLTAVVLHLNNQPDDPSVQGTQPPTNGSEAPTQTPTNAPTEAPTQAPTQAPTEPPVTLQSTATIGATGDILMHDRLIQSGYDSETGTYNYDEIFRYFQAYVSQVDYAVANLEVTLCGSDNGYKYQGYPCFNCPDAIVDALKAAGFDMLLTANNHAYDTRNVGLLRTQNTLLDRGMDYIGTRLEADAPNYQVVDVNGIRIGMINYTYNTSQEEDGTISLNGIPLTNADSQLVNSFNNWQLDKFYARLEKQMEAMYAEGAEAFVMYIHWGEEYKTVHNDRQAQIAQDLCNMGIDVIVGNHAHVPQGAALLTSETDETHKTVCLYSTGNSISNISRDDGRPKNTEDGMLFTFTFAKYSDGTVVVQDADILPTWVYRYWDGDWTRKFLILTLDDTIADWQDYMMLTDAQLNECQDSYNRTMDIVSPGLAQINTWLQENQAAIESELGVQK